MEKEMQQLFIQFMVSKGIKEDLLNYKELKKEYFKDFKKWFIEMNDAKKKYVKFLEEMDLRFKNKDCIEVYKGKKDSIGLPYDTTSLTTLMGYQNNEKLICENLIMFDGKPTIIKNGKQEEYLIYYLLSNFNVFYTQNPYEFTLINGWENLSNKYNKDIIVGVYGNINDVDKNKKKEQIFLLASKLDKNYKFEYVTDNNNYYCAVGTKNIKRRSR